LLVLDKIIEFLLSSFRKRKTVILLVEHISSWGRCKPLYLTLRWKFKVIIVIAPTKDDRIIYDLKYRTEEIALEVAKIDPNYHKGYIESGWCDIIKDFSPDGIVLMHPYDILRSDKYHVENLSANAKIFYNNYGYMLSNSKNLHYNNPFFKSCDRIYVESRHLIDGYAGVHGAEWANNKCLVSGLPNMDCYNEPIKHSDYQNWPSLDKASRRVIVAPHWTVKWQLDNGDMVQGYCNFMIFKDAFLELFKTYSDIDFIFRAHPLMFDSLVKNNMMSEIEVEKYKEILNDFDNVLFDEKIAEYTIFFKTSDALITDGVSFLGEYLPTKKPIIQTFSKNYPGFNSFGELITSSNYKVENPQDLFEVFERIIVQQDDYNKENRLDILQKHFFVPGKGGASQIIANDIARALREK
jgi:CDP-glycerol glycerophosphotransferase (TagB/SpsB family)